MHVINRRIGCETTGSENIWSQTAANKENHKVIFYTMQQRGMIPGIRHREVLDKFAKSLPGACRDKPQSPCQKSILKLKKYFSCDN